MLFYWFTKMFSSRWRTSCAGGAVRSLACLVAAAAIQPATVLAQAGAPVSGGGWNLAVSYALRESFDGNVYLQDIGRTARQGSMVTSATPALALGYRRGQAFRATFTYAPEIVRFHSQRSENHVAHRADLGLAGTSGRTSWEFTNSLVAIDGSNQGPIFDVASKCDIPALGGIPIRDRRDAVIMRNGLRVTHTMGRWFVRPTVTTYIHDFRTQQRARTGAYLGYENYIDRWEATGGVDVGYAVGEKTWMVAGHRYGRQEQGRLLGAASPYSNNYHRVLAGVEGSPAAWLRLSALAGPDIRQFGRAPAGFDAGELLWFINASASWLPDPNTAVTVTVSRFEQPAFSSHSVYEDLVYDVTWRRRVGKRVSVAAGFRAYGGDWQAPVEREDWIYTPTASAAWAFHERLTAEVCYSYDSVRSRVPGTHGREYTRPIFSAGVRGSF